MPRSIYLPLKLGSRLAKNSWMPSEASSVLRVFRNARTSMSIALSIGASSPSSTASMMSRVAIGGRLAMRRASALASLSVSPSFVSLLARPSATHSCAGICVPRIRNSSAFVRPISRGIRCEPPKPGVIPRFDSVCPIRAPSFRSRKWQAIAISQPPPSAWPLIAAMTGLGKRSIFRSTSLPKRMKASTLSPANAEPRSAPAQKILSPLPVMMRHRTLSSLSKPLTAAFSSRTSVSLIALAGGRFSVMTACASSRVTTSVSNPIRRDSSEKDGRHRFGGLGQAVAALAEHPGRRHLIHGAEEHLGRDLHGQVGADLPARHTLVQDRSDEIEVRRDFVRGRAAEELVTLAQLDLHHFGQIGITLEDGEVERDQPADLRFGPAFRRDLAAHEGHPLRHLFPEERDEDLVLGAEVEVDRAARNPGFSGDVGHARVVIPVASEHADGRVDDLLRLGRIAHWIELNRRSL